jgi:hypothetical protein
MSELWTFLAENYRQLNGVDWAILFVATVLIGAGIFAALHWLYRSRFDAQRDVLDLRKEEISDLRQRLDTQAEHQKELTNQLSAMESNRAVLLRDYESTLRKWEGADKALKMTAPFIFHTKELFLLSSYLIVAHYRVLQQYELLEMYVRFGAHHPDGAPRPGDVLRRLVKLQSSLSGASDVFAPLLESPLNQVRVNVHVDIPRVLQQHRVEEVLHEVGEIEDSLRSYVQRVLKSRKAIGP